MYTSLLNRSRLARALGCCWLLVRRGEDSDYATTHRRIFFFFRSQLPAMQRSSFNFFLFIAFIIKQRTSPCYSSPSSFSSPTSHVYLNRRWAVQISPRVLKYTYLINSISILCLFLSLSLSRSRCCLLSNLFPFQTTIATHTHTAYIYILHAHH